MIILTSTDRIRVRLGGAVTANELECFVSYRDTTSTTIGAGRNSTFTSGTSFVTLVSAPAASTQRVIDYISIYNADISIAKVEIFYDDGVVGSIIATFTIEEGEKIEYQEGKGFKVINQYGCLKLGNELNYNGAITEMSSTVLSSDVINNNAVANTIQDITGLSFSVNSGTTYWFRFIIPFNSAATTTGSRFSINGPGLAYLYYESFYTTSSGATPTINLGLSAYNTPAAATLTSALTGNIAIIEGIVRPSSSGTLIARFASEVANSAITARAGAIVYYKDIF